MQELNFKGLACPGPVLKTKELLESTAVDSLRILVDNEAAKQNVSRFIQTRGFTASVEDVEGGFAVVGTKDAAEEACEIMSDAELGVADTKTMIMIATNKMGSGDDTLGERLMVNFLSTLKEMEGLWRLVFVNNGVKLTVEGAETLPIIQELEKSGVSVLVCGTCLTFFNLMDKKQVGETTNMLDIVTSMQVAGKVINL